MKRRAARALAMDTCLMTNPVGPRSDLLSEDVEFQNEILPSVSRTFALTIPQLPESLCLAVSNAYLLCRIADTIEDDVALTAQQKHLFHDVFTAVVHGQSSSESFADQLYPLLSQRTLEAERELVRRTPQIARITQALNTRQRKALQRCVRIMCEGMPRFQRNKSLSGLKDQHELDQYCYFVAGVVGEMLTELFCDYSDEIAQRHDEMMKLSVSFGQGLQMTNILKDIWEDRKSDTCWLPREVFRQAGYDLDNLAPGQYDTAFGAGLERVVGVAHAYLRNALAYTQLIPSRETGIRRFCLWSIGLAVLTLRKIHNNPRFTAGVEVKVSRRAVKATILTTNLAARSNGALSFIFNLSAKGLPLMPVTNKSHPLARRAT